MNTIVTFRLCTLTNNELLAKVDKGIDKLYEENKILSRYIPARPNEDFDLLVGELLVRFKNLINEQRNTNDRVTETL